VFWVRVCYKTVSLYLKLEVWNPLSLRQHVTETSFARAKAMDEELAHAASLLYFGG
jgi:hypothetical protein